MSIDRTLTTETLSAIEFSKLLESTGISREITMNWCPKLFDRNRCYGTVKNIAKNKYVTICSLSSFLFTKNCLMMPDKAHLYIKDIHCEVVGVDGEKYSLNDIRIAAEIFTNLDHFARVQIKRQIKKNPEWNS